MKSPNLPLFSLLALAASQLGGASVALDTDIRHQTWRGAGTCLTPWAPDKNALYAEEWFQRVYVEDLGFNLLRIELMPDAHPQVAKPEDIKYQNFNLDTGGGPHAQNDRNRVFLNFAKAMKALNPDSQVLGTAWSVPGWMKDNNSSLNGGAPKPEFYPHAAQWLLEWVKLYESHGLNMSAISIANEPQYAQFYNSQVIDPAPYAAFLKVVAERFAAQGYGHIMFYGPEHMTLDGASNINYLKAMKTAGSLGYLTAVASHGYTNGVETDTNPNSASSFWRMVVKRFAPGKEFWVTEGGTGEWSYGASLDQMAAMIHHGLADGNVSLWTPWQVEGDFTAGGNHTIKSAIGRHYFGSIKPGAVRVDVSPSGADGSSLNVLGFMHAGDQSLTVVILNRTLTAQSLDLSLADDIGLDAWTGTRTSSDSVQFQVMKSVPKPVGRSTMLTIPSRSLTTLRATGLDFDTAIFNEGWAYHADLGWTWAAARRSKLGYSITLGALTQGGSGWHYSYERGAWLFVRGNATTHERWVYDLEMGWLYGNDTYGRYLWRAATDTWYLDWQPLTP